MQLQHPHHPHSLSSSPTGALCAGRGTGVAVACLAFGVRKTPGADGGYIASWVADAVGRAVASASDTRSTSGAVRVGLRVSPKTPNRQPRLHKCRPNSEQQFKAWRSVGRTMQHHSSQLHSTAATSSRPPSRHRRGNSRCLGAIGPSNTTAAIKESMQAEAHATEERRSATEREREQLANGPHQSGPFGQSNLPSR